MFIWLRKNLPYIILTSPLLIDTLNGVMIKGLDSCNCICMASKNDDLWSTFTEVSGRGNMIDAALEVIKQRSIIFDIFGQDEQFLEGVEVVLYDLFGSYSIIMTILGVYLCW